MDQNSMFLPSFASSAIGKGHKIISWDLHQGILDVFWQRSKNRMFIHQALHPLKFRVVVELDGLDGH
jgi:hypothetical protein